jgi:uncharacterized protein with HEPN domain
VGEAGAALTDLLQTLIAWGERCARVIDGMTKSDFMKNETAQLAAQKCIEAMGECANKILKLHPEFAAKNPELELLEVYQMRNRLAHGYESVNLTTVWNTSREDVPSLVNLAATALGRLDTDTKS